MVPVSCFRSPTSSIFSLMASLSAGVHDPDSGIDAATGTTDLKATAMGSSIHNRGGEHGPCLHPPPGSRKTSEGSARHSQQTLTICLGHPSLSGFLLFQQIQLTTRW
ncbi:hypothetical protein ATANTOWER_001627 [Ataeniobius toweri]|uniref:Uncharacterized protein n=1 Tax=Ataeniobius toweri TaxID=208326 RepID=A0ABU7C8C8_9TELE|nr:hypothetical protein [Ataeniobius toweri]